MEYTDFQTKLLGDLQLGDPFRVVSKADQKFLALPDNVDFTTDLLRNLNTESSTGGDLAPEDVGPNNRARILNAIQDRKAEYQTIQQFKARENFVPISLQAQQPQAQLQMPDVSSMAIFSGMFDQGAPLASAPAFQPQGLLGNLATKGMNQIMQGQAMNPTLGKAKS
tara:strand:+ start:12479 stop:12979 length:501 start_codon:yes stop_codon:yes gene_type:complete